MADPEALVDKGETSPATVRRIGAVPYKHSRKGPRVLLITSLTRSRWVFPKGVVRPGESDIDACVREVFEEAGLRGAVSKDFPLEAFVDKSTEHEVQTVPVTFYPFLVAAERRRWPERHLRIRRWFLFPDVAPVVDPDTAGVFSRFEDLVAGGCLSLDL